MHIARRRSFHALRHHADNAALPHNSRRIAIRSWGLLALALETTLGKVARGYHYRAREFHFPLSSHDVHPRVRNPDANPLAVEEVILLFPASSG